MRRRLAEALFFPLRCRHIGLAGALMMTPPFMASALAFDIALDLPDATLSWDNTVKYNLAGRTGKVNPDIAGRTPGYLNNGDRNFERGSVISNRVDLLTELNFGYQRLGARLSAAAWYDRAYKTTNDNPGPAPAAAAQPFAFNQFSPEVNAVHGSRAELLDALVFGATNLTPDVGASIRFGRHSFYWGESLFYGTNGIAGTMAPIDVIKAVSVPGTAFKDLLRKVPQVSGELSFGSRLSLGGYYQFKWEKSRLPEPGSYFSTFNYSVPRPELKPDDKGQYGLQLKYSPADWNTDFGLYATRFHSKTPGGVYQLFAPPSPAPIGTRSYFHEGSRAYGISSNTSIDIVNLGLEASVRRNMPLASGPVRFTATSGNTDDSAGYAVGTTGHLQASFIVTLPRTDLIQEQGLSAEIAWNRRLSVDRNPGAVDPQTDRDATALQFVYTPTFRQVAPGWDLAVPVSVSYVNGKSGALGPGWGADRSGTYSLALNTTYRALYSFSLRYVGYYGPTGVNTVPGPGLPSYTQNLRDRNYIAFTASTGF